VLIYNNRTLSGETLKRIDNDLYPESSIIIIIIEKWRVNNL
jgi:hypothetical protein